MEKIHTIKDNTNERDSQLIY